ncbi:MAG: hypothetical protein GTO17_12050 [Candidatus Aminicenantes bacterium]|nr:hypothetical protein [Candidatus Aminicenantes bacterium]
MRNLTILILSAFMTFVLGIKILSSQVTKFQMWQKPYIKISISPTVPTTQDMITFNVFAHGLKGPGIERITIKVNDRKVKVCLMSPCVYTGGPYPEGLLSYSVTVLDVGWHEYSSYGPWIIQRKLYIKNPASLPKREEGLSRRVIHLIPLAENEETRWGNGIVPLPFPGEDDDLSGFAKYRYNAVLEDDRVYQKVLLMHPPDWHKDGMIVGIFKIENLPENAIFKAKVGFLEESVQGDVKGFRVFVNEDPTYYAAKQCFYDGHLDELSLNLDKYAGQNVELVLQVLVLPVIFRTSIQDGSVWVDPRIEW